MSRMYVPQIMDALKKFGPRDRQELLYALATDRMMSEDLEDLVDLLRTRREPAVRWETFKARLRKQGKI